MYNRAQGNKKGEADDVLARKNAHSNVGVSSVVHASGSTPPASPQFQSKSPSQLLKMQGIIGNSAVQRLLNPTAVMLPHAPGCTCPGCSSHMKTVHEEEPHAPFIQREEDEQAEASTEEYGNAVDQGVDSGAAQTSSDPMLSQGGNTETSATLSVQEEFQPLDTGGKPDFGLQLATGRDVGSATVEEQTATAVAPGGFTAGGQVGTAPVQVTDQMPEDGVPHAFTNGGQTGTVAWAGGGGAGPRGNEGVGTMQTHVVPTYSSGPDPATPGAFIAWVDAGTGRIDVTRSYLGAITGNQGNGQYVSAAAAGRFNAHEVQHVNSTSGFYNTHIAPLLLRVAAHYPGGTTVGGASAAAAVTALQTTINWATSVSAFQTADTAANTPMGTIDTADLNSGTYPENRGPGTIAGTAYTNRVATPGEVLPT